MAHFAKVIDGVVEEVLVVDKEFIETGALGDPSLWIQTSYNTNGGVYYTPNTNNADSDQSKALRKNYASIGDFYDDKLDAFITPKKFESWIFDSDLCRWVSPLPYPDDGLKYQWDDFSVSWKLIEDKE
jgi:hypothetical protein